MTRHYRSYATVLVRLAKIGRPELRNLLEEAAQFVGAQKAKRTSRRADLVNPGDREPVTLAVLNPVI
jgi:hypothetical protein